jgi:hypothetical protein
VRSGVLAGTDLSTLTPDQVRLVNQTAPGGGQAKDKAKYLSDLWGSGDDAKQALALKLGYTPLGGIPARGQVDFTKLQALPDPALRLIQTAFDANEQAALYDIRMQFQEEDRRIKETGAPGLTMQNILARGDVLRDAALASLSNAKIAGAAAKSTAIATYATNQANLAWDRALKMLEDVDAANYDQLPQMMMGMIGPVLLSLGYSNEEVGGMLGSLAESGWHAAVSSLVETRGTATSTVDDLVALVRGVNYPSGETPSKQEALAWLKAGGYVDAAGNVTLGEEGTTPASSDDVLTALPDTLFVDARFDVGKLGLETGAGRAAFRTWIGTQIPVWKSDSTTRDAAIWKILRWLTSDEDTQNRNYTYAVNIYDALKAKGLV